MLTVSSTTKQKVPISSKPVDANGVASPIETPAVVTVTSGAGTWEAAPGADGLLGYVVSEDVAGTSEYSVANGGLTDTISYSYTLPAPVATDLGLSSGDAIDK